MRCISTAELDLSEMGINCSLDCEFCHIDRLFTHRQTYHFETKRKLQYLLLLLYFGFTVVQIKVT